MKLIEFLYNKIDKLFFLTIIIVTIYLFYPSLKYNKLPGYNDLLLYSNWRTHIRLALNNGEFPLWLPCQMGGIPLTASYNPSLFYPLTLLLFFFNNNTFTNIIYILHFIFIPFFMYIFLRHNNYEKIVCVIASAFWAWSGYILVRYWVGHTCFIIAFTYFPLVLLFYLKSLSNNNFIFIWLTSLFMGLQFFSGRPELVIYTHIILFFYLIKSIFKKELKILPAIKKIFFIYLFFLILIFIQLIPLIEFNFYSIRGKSFEYSVLISFPFQNFITYFLPYFFGEHLHFNFWGVQNFFEQYCYVGILPIILFILFLFQKKNSIKYFYLIIIIFGWLIALGKYNPFYYYISKIILPISKLRAPSRAMFFGVFGFTMLTAEFLNEFVRRNFSFSNIQKKILIFCIVSGFLLTIIFFVPQSFIIQNINKIIKFKNIELAYTTFHWKLLHFSLLIIIYPIVFIIIKNKKILMLILFAVCLYETIYFNNRYIDYDGIKTDYANDSVIKKLKQDASYYRLLSAEQIIENSKYNIQNINTVLAFTPVYIKDVCDYLAIGVDKRTNYLKESEKHWWGINYIKNYNSVLLDLFNAKYFYKYEINDEINFQKISDDLYMKKDFFPRFKFFYDYVYESSFSKTIELLNDKNFDYKKTVIVNNFKFDKNKMDNVSDENRIKSIKYNYNSIEMNVDVKKNSILFLSEIYYPGWKVYVNDKKSELLKLNNIFRGVYCHTGDLKIKFQYLTDYFFISIILFLLFFLCGIIILLYSRFRS